MAKNSMPDKHDSLAKSKESLIYDVEADNLKDFWLPDYILLPEPEVKKPSQVPASPVIVFINSRSGGQLGGELLLSYRALLNPNQVFDLNEKTPDKVLHQLYFNLEKHKRNGDSFAADIEKRLRIIVAGGDGTAGWILGVIADLKLAHPPPVATVPLGTGNNLPFAFGWGKKNPGTDHGSVKSFLDQVRNGKEMKIDSWHVLMRMRVPKDGSRVPVAPPELPHSLHAFQLVSPSDASNEEGYLTFRGGFWNYFSMGMDAQVSYAFHAERKLHPEKFKNQSTNQSTYAKLTCTQGWFCASLFHPSSQNIAQLVKARIMRKPGHWEDLTIPRSIRSIICLNLPSFSGGLNPWGKPTRSRFRSRDWTPPYVDDGFIEVVGFRDAWHGAILYAPGGHGTRLAQARGIRFEFYKGSVDHTFMRMDGEPWKQPLPVDNDESVVIEISHFHQVSMLASTHNLSKSVNEPPSPRPYAYDYDSDEEEFEEISEERSKLGAATSFQLPEEFDIAQLS